MNTGALGQGASLGMGLALAAKYGKKDMIPGGGERTSVTDTGRLLRDTIQGAAGKYEDFRLCVCRRGHAAGI